MPALFHITQKINDLGSVSKYRFSRVSPTFIRGLSSDMKLDIPSQLYQSIGRRQNSIQERGCASIEIRKESFPLIYFDQ